MFVSNPEIVILCGGFGVRMYDLTLQTQKCMLPFHGRPILEHLLEQIANAFGQAKIIFCLGHDSDSVMSHFFRSYRDLELTYTQGSTKGTRLALLSAKNLIQGDHFLSMDGDTIIQGSELLELTKTKNSNSLGTILLSKNKSIAKTHGIATMQGKQVVGLDFPPTTPLSGRYRYRFMDTGFYSKKLFDALETHIVPATSHVLARTIKDGQLLEGKVCQTPWLHFESPKDLKRPLPFTA